MKPGSAAMLLAAAPFGKYQSSPGAAFLSFGAGTSQARASDFWSPSKSVGSTWAKRRPGGALKFRSEPCQRSGVAGTSSALRIAKPALAAGAGVGSGIEAAGGSTRGSDDATPNGV